jgi:hypothetical protein
MNIIIENKNPNRMNEKEEERGIILFFLVNLLLEQPNNEIFIRSLSNDSYHGYGISVDSLTLSPNKPCIIKLIKPEEKENV